MEKEIAKISILALVFIASSELAGGFLKELVGLLPIPPIIVYIIILVIGVYYFDITLK